MDDFIFEMEDMNITEGTPDIITGAPAPPAEGTAPEPPAATTEETEPSIEIPEGTSTTETNTEEHSSEGTPSSEANSSQNSTLYALAKYLKDEGVLLVEDELKEISNLEELKAIIEQSHSKARYKDMSETQQRYLDALENGVPTKEYETLEKDISTFEKITDESIEADPQLRYELLAIDFMNQGIDQDRAMKLAQLSVKEDSNIEDAKTALSSILTFKTDKYKELIGTKKEQTELDLKSIKEAIDGKEKLLEMDINTITKNKLFDQMTTKVASDDNGLPLNKLQKFQRDNPIESNILMNYLFMMTNEGKDLGLIKTNTTSSAAKELEQKLKSLNFDSTGSLIIPDEMIGNKGSTTNKDNITINI